MLKGKSFISPNGNFEELQNCEKLLRIEKTY